MLAYWETDNPAPKSKWGIKLYQSLSEGSEARRLADQFELKDVLSSNGCSLILSALMEKYRPYLEVAVPASIDRFFLFWRTTKRSIVRVVHRPEGDLKDRDGNAPPRKSTG